MLKILFWSNEKWRDEAPNRLVRRREPAGGHFIPSQMAAHDANSGSGPYYGDMAGGERGERWRMMLRLLTRHRIEDEEAFKPQPFSLIVTISDPEKKARVYDEMAQIVRNRFQSQNLTVRTAARVKTRQ